MFFSKARSHVLLAPSALGLIPFPESMQLIFLKFFFLSSSIVESNEETVLFDG